MVEYRKGTIPERCVTFGSALALWQEVNKSRHKRATNMRYANLIDRHIAPELSNIRISQINTALLSDFMNRKLESGRLDGKGGCCKTRHFQGTGKNRTRIASGIKGRRVLDPRQPRR